MNLLDEELDPKQIMLAVDAIRKLNKEVKNRTDALAKELGLNPEFDMLVVPTSMTGRKFTAPRWLQTVNHNSYTKDWDGKPFLRKGVRNPRLVTERKDEND